MVCAISGTAAVALQEKQVKEAEAFVGIGYAVSKMGATPEQAAIIGVGGAVQGAIDGAIYGAVFGGPVGLAVGLGVGL